MPTTLQPLNGHGVRAVALRAAVDALAPGAFDRLPMATRILAENVLRGADPARTDALLSAIVGGDREADLPFFPARVILQDLLGTPALVDLAGLRDAVADGGGDPAAVNPVIPTQLVVDHSLSVEADGTRPDALRLNMEIEQRRNAERFEFLDWARRAFRNLEVVMPGNGILHQLNLERMSPVVQVRDGVAFADTVIGTDSHTTMINGLGVLGWGVGGIEAESVMLGRPIWLRLPPVIAVELRGERRAGVQATDLVLALAEFLRAEGVVGSILEVVGHGAAGLSVPDRATLSNMGPEFGATAVLFPIDGRTLEFLRLTGRSPEQVALVEGHARAQGLWATHLETATYGRRLVFDLSGVGRAIAGPARPHQRVPLDRLVQRGIATPAPGGGGAAPAVGLEDGAVVIAAITSCTNTSNPRNLVAAGLVARNAVSRGLGRKRWVKTSFAPGSLAVPRYLDAAGLSAPLRALGFGVVGFGCTSCNGMSGPLAPEIEREILERRLATAAVLSGNRNFDGRIHPRVRSAFLASPALVVAYAIAGTMRVDLEREPLGVDPSGRPVTLAELWPADAEVDALVAAHVRPEAFELAREARAREAGGAPTRAVAPRYAWREDSTYVRRPPYWDASLTRPATGRDMRALVMLGDDVSTDDLSPSGAILPESATGRFLLERGVPPAEFNSYGTRRGDHVVAVRATFANPRLRNELAPEVEGSFTRLEPGGPILPIFEAAQTWLERGRELVVLAGRNYGCGSSRDWAAKGVRLLGVRAVVAESFERIHRTNLVGMGVLPLELAPGTTRGSLRLDGFETFTLEGLAGAPAPGTVLTLAIARRDGRVERAPARCRIDTADEQRVFAAGGLLPRIASELLQPRLGPPPASPRETPAP
jgi:aconitate hydratase